MAKTTTVAVMIHTSNAAFELHPAVEVGRMLHEIANTFIRENEMEPRALRDVNGNVCGEIKVLIIGTDEELSRSRDAYEHGRGE